MMWMRSTVRLFDPPIAVFMTSFMFGIEAEDLTKSWCFEHFHVGGPPQTSPRQRFCIHYTEESQPFESEKHCELR